MFKKKSMGLSKAERVVLSDCLQELACSIASFVAFKLEADEKQKEEIKKDYYDAVKDFKETCELFRDMNKDDLDKKYINL